MQTATTGPERAASLSSHPRRASPANSLTLQNHFGLNRDASLRASLGSARSKPSNVHSPRRNSSGDSHKTGLSDPKKWFDRSNENPTATFDSNVMEVDPPFFLKGSESSTEDRVGYKNLAIPQHLQPRPQETQSSSADDYRSVIDDLTVEIQKLKDELKRYKQRGPDTLRKDQLFEIKFHGLPKRKKRELETTLREFAANLGDSSSVSSLQQKKPSHDKLNSGSGSKHASSSSGSHARPVDSAYASMSTGAHSSRASLGRHGSNQSGIRSSEQKVESYLRDIPEGLYPKHVAMTDKDRKKVVVRRLEHLFTGPINNRHGRRQLPLHTVPHQPASEAALAPPSIPTLTWEAAQPQQPQQTTDKSEPTREARILPPGSSSKKSRSRDNGSASNSNGDQTESTGNGTNGSPPDRSPPEQRPTRPNDLDPDRAQIPADNMEYIRHLGLVPPELLPDATQETPDVAPDAEGWVYLNLLCSLAQLHMINVTPDFVRAAVAEISTKFQLSPDGRKIRWRGGSEGTKLTSDSSIDSSEMSERPSDFVSKDSKKSKRKRQKVCHFTGDSGISCKDNSKFRPQVSSSSDSFHYKPLFVRQDSPNGVVSFDDTLSSFGPVDDSNLGESRYDLSGSGSWNRKKRRRDGAVIYYGGAPFCTDLSGDPGDVSPTAYMMSSGQNATASSPQPRRPLYRSPSGSSIGIRPLSHPIPPVSSTAPMEIDHDEDPPGFATDSGDETTDADIEFSWSDEPQYLEVHPLEPCGLGGVLPDDHFMVVVTTKRPKEDAAGAITKYGQDSRIETTDNMIARLAVMSTSSPAAQQSRQSSRCSTPGVEIEYTSGRIKRLTPVPLPPPVIFFPPFSSDDSYDYEDMSDSDPQSQSMPLVSEGLLSRRGLEQSDDYPDGVDLSSGDEEGDDPDEESGAERMYDIPPSDEVPDIIPLEQIPRHSIGSSVAAAGTPRGRTKSASSSDDEDEDE
ncbi:frequency clock protein [Akanthomyces lecanii RCEF 1005]|uniref:Frequency clock protein n=1 Tax=Akanthomyces lecanii RCEF 1005 TaxID=1081108 RepID=A0A169YIG6_CORDF|nr:frequency clock protein [Akanthomyces lecanii RCEF 1005]